ncbi:chromosome segregation protein SMC [Terasakiispira papahanaumokuakeensis]|uniref:Chromosome partition protein Smc n=1 Tax=Terasakiispira papahanaumokuakeensis TaxID=197479 RepID=A0A1E2VBB6_9GAMM|nr:chromosome segregation protein SMC [Terasakiispira papahanaumokuakeensis]ODC04126.1 chromosome segregation protein SMC [Terasakiispira papahanaumokuakeensis]
MRLKSIKLAGFKSFVDPTTVPFKSNMSAIVGPNGCGKSNVIDAVRWVMGESSAKYLRGESMTDVIFNGSRGRKPVGQASIELVFDNTAGKLGGAYAQYAEIAVKRQVTREGQSNYFLNGTKCRRRDITDLFLGTGLGPRSYAIIEQGMIARLIEAKPEELRVYLEEAAGISKYKERRRETENRMRRTEDNLERLEDVRDELGRQLERLSRQAEAARRYQQLKADERRLRGELAVLRWREADHQLKGIIDQVRELELEVEAHLVEIRRIESELETARQTQTQAADALDDAQARFHETGQAIARLEQHLQHRTQRARQLQQDLEALMRSEQELNESDQSDRARLTELEEALASLQPELEALDEQHLMAEEALAQQSEQLEDCQARWETFREHADRDQREAELARASIQQHETNQTQLKQRLQRLSEQASSLESTTQLDEQITSLTLEREAMQDQIQTLDEEAEQLQQQRESLREQVQQLRDQLDQRRTRYQQNSGRLASLQALQQAALKHDDEGVNQWLAQQGLAHEARLAEKLVVAPGWEHAVETVLADQLQALVLPGALPDAQLEALAQSPQGSLSLMVDTQLTASPDQTLAAYVQGPDAVRRGLAKILVVPSLAEGLVLRPTLTAEQSCITPEGYWLGPDWLRIHPADQNDDGPLARQRALEVLEVEQDELAETIESTAEHLTRLERDLESGEQKRQTLVAQQKPIQGRVSQLSSELATLETRRGHIAERQGQMAEEREELAIQMEDTEMALMSARDTWQAALARVENNVEQREALDRARQQARDAVEQARQAQSQYQQTRQQLQLKRQELLTSQQGMTEGLARTQQQRDRLYERRQTLEAALEEIHEPDDTQQAQLDELLDQHAQQEEAVSQLRQRQQTAYDSQSTLEQSRTEHDRQLERVRARLDEVRMQQQNLMAQRDAHLSQLAEMDVTLRDILPDLPEDATESAWRQTLDNTVERIRRLGAINLAAIEEFEQQQTRKGYLDAQYAELMEALDTLSQAIRRIDRETRSRFKETFEQVNQGLQTLFPKVFGGGTAWLQLTGEDLLETGVAIMARPPGKKNATIHLLSGGEKALTALALVFSIFQLNPAPFCMLDEVDAPLDDANVGRYANLVREMSDRIQFIYITHNKQAMEKADQLMGVTMQEPGVSRLVSVDMTEAEALVQ